MSGYRHEMGPDGVMIHEKLLGNGKLTVAARISSVIGAGLAAMVVTGGSFVLNYIWSEYRATQKDTADTLKRIELYIAGATERGINRDFVDRAIRMDLSRVEGIVGTHEVRIVRLETRKNDNR